ncbi:hypothetical protein [uncultured Jannaschia sp.]|uniref:hypothetical protein n=1 Tax=uncultured Jannaschia sp. TaxID=293347 RepID=UPI0026377715|nr:hypothetical protein [uncultured Jannaschia sp.]
MACRTAKAKRAATATKEATKAVDDLEQMIKGQEAAKKKDFFARIADDLEQTGASDAEQIEYNMDIKTEYSSEFSLDAVADAVSKTIHAAAATLKAQEMPSPATSAEALEAYSDVVVSVAEAARSSSETATSISYSMNRIGRGLFAFLYATSAKASDKETFGEEAITATAIFYRIMRSGEDAKRQERFDTVLLYVDALHKAKVMQVALLDDLGNGTYDPDEYIAKDAQMQKVVDLWQKRVDEAKLDRADGPVMMGAGPGGPMGTGGPDLEAVAKRALSKISAGDDRLKAIVERSEARLAAGHFR